MGTKVSKPRVSPGAPQRVSDTSTTGESRAARSMGTMGRSVLRRAKQAHYARAACGALGTFALAVACAVARGATLGSPEAIALAAVLGLLAFAAWVRSETVSSREVLERVDRRLHLGGAFLAAQESCERTPGSAVAQLGAARLLQRVRPSQVIEAAVPHTLGFVVLPLLGLLVLVQTVQSRDARRGRAGIMNIQVGAIADGLGNLAVEHGATLTDEQRAKLAEIQEKAAAAAKLASESSLGQPADEDSADYREELRAVAEELDALADEAPSGSGLADDLSDAAASAEALAMDASAVDQSTSSPATSEAAASGEPASGLADAGDGQFAGNAQGDGSGASGDAPAGDESAQESAPGSQSAETPSAVAPSGGDSTAPEDSGSGPSTAPSDPTRKGTATGQAGGKADTPSNSPHGGASSQEATQGGPQVAEPDPGASQEPAGAEAALTERRWWSDRDDGIVRAWLSRRAPK